MNFNSVDIERIESFCETITISLDANVKENGIEYSYELVSKSTSTVFMIYLWVCLGIDRSPKTTILFTSNDIVVDSYIVDEETDYYELLRLFQCG